MGCDVSRMACDALETGVVGVHPDFLVLSGDIIGILSSFSGCWVGRRGADFNTTTGPRRPCKPRRFSSSALDFVDKPPISAVSDSAATHTQTLALIANHHHNTKELNLSKKNKMPTVLGLTNSPSPHAGPGNGPHISSSTTIANSPRRMSSFPPSPPKKKKEKREKKRKRKQSKNNDN